MARNHKLLALGGINGAVEPLAQALQNLTDDVVAIAVVGDLGGPAGTPETYRAVFRTLGRAERPTYWVPGATDTGLRHYLHDTSGLEIAFPQLHGVHGRVVDGPDHILFAGMGGEIVDGAEDPPTGDELRYSGREAEYRLREITEFKEHPRVLLFTTQPAHKGARVPGSDAVAGLIKTYRPRLAIVAGDGVSEERLGTTLVVSSGRIDRGQYAVIDLNDLAIEVGDVTEHAAV
jgi:Icc-related predicted phosphoesterase